MVVARGVIVVVAVAVLGCGAKGKAPAGKDGVPPRPDVGNATTGDTVEATAARPELQIKQHDEHVDLPPVPAFELPAVEPGYHSVREVLVHGGRLRDTEVKVRGFVSWIYSCADAVAEPGMSKKQIQKKIDDDPTICERPKFYLADTATARPEASLWVVDVPRAPNNMEKRHLPPAELAAWPKVPKIALGDRVTVVGTLALRSPHAESNSDGLLVYASLSHDKPGATTEVPAPALPSAVQPAPLAPTPPPGRIARATRDAADELLHQCTAELATRRLAEAAEHCQQATETWPGHHGAWWTLGEVAVAKKDWDAAVAAFEHTTALDPEAAMYHLWLGYAQYQARTEGRGGGMPDPYAADLDPPLASLLRAVAQEPRLYMAHYYIGRIHRDKQRDREAAEAFTTAIKMNPYEGNPFIALAQLYLRWGYLDEAIRVATAGTRTVPGGHELSNVWLLLGQAYDDHAEPDRALEAYEAALVAQADNAAALFQRGQARYRRGNYAGAKVDLEAFAGTANASQAETRHATHKMLLQIAAKKR